MGRAERRAKNREEAKQRQGARPSASDPGPGTLQGMAGERPETQNETARRLYRTGGKPERRRKTRRRISDKPPKWREGHQ